MSRVVALPMILPLLRSLTFTYGMAAEYSVGFVKLIFALKVKDDLVVSLISRDPTCGLNFVMLQPDKAIPKHQRLYILPYMLKTGD